MRRQNIIFGSLLLIVLTAIIATGYVTGRGPLGVISIAVSRLTSGEQMIPSGSITEETKAPAAPEISSGYRAATFAEANRSVCITESVLLACARDQVAHSLLHRGLSPLRKRRAIAA